MSAPQERVAREQADASRAILRGSLTIGIGLVSGSVIGFGRVALTAYLLGTGTDADCLAVGIGPLDTINSILTNTMVFAFVPLLAAREGARRDAMFSRLHRLFSIVFCGLAAAMSLFAPYLVQVLAPGLHDEALATAATIFRVASLSSAAAGMTAIHAAYLFTDRRFAPTAFSQALLNAASAASALLLWNRFGIYGFAIGYSAGAWIQLAIVWWLTRGARRAQQPGEGGAWTGLLLRPVVIVVYAALIALNVIVTRAHATTAGPGMAAAFEYCLRCIGLPLAILISPLSNALLPEVARLRNGNRLRDAFRMIDRWLTVAGLLAVAGCVLGLLVREPVIALLFERGSFTASSTRLVSAVFLGFAPSLIGWSLLELTSRSLFALDRPWVTLSAAAIPAAVNLWVMQSISASDPQLLGAGSSLGLTLAFFCLFAATRSLRDRWLAQSAS